MSDYQPTSRRPIAGIFRRSADSVVRWCVRRRVHPNTISLSSIVAAAVAGAAFWQAGRVSALLIIAGVFCFVRLWLNMLDGMVAIAGGTASRTGELANELPDRISDTIIFIGAGYSGLCSPAGGYLCAIMALLVSHLGTLGQAVGVQREFSGVMSKPWRMVTLTLGAAVTLALLWFGDGRIAYGGLTILDMTFLVVIAGCVQTYAVRLLRIVRAIKSEARA